MYKILPYINLKKELDGEGTLFKEEDITKPLGSLQIYYGGLTYKSHFIDTEAKLDRFIDILYNLDDKRIAFDTETHDLYGYIVGLSFSYNNNSGFYIPVAHDFGVQIDKDIVYKKLKPLLEDDQFTFICHNAAYEIVVCLQDFDTEPRKFHDTMAMGYLLDNTQPLKLKTRSEIELGLESTQSFEEIVPKGSFANEHSIYKVGIYAIQDTVLTRMLFFEFAKSPDLPFIRKSYFECEVKAIKAFARMKYNGIRVNPETIKTMKKFYQAEVKELLNKIYYEASYNPETKEFEATYDPETNTYTNLPEFNVNSGPQKTSILIDRLGLPIVSKSRKTGKPSFDKKALDKYKERGDWPIINYIARYNKLNKVLTTYTDKITDRLTIHQRVHPNFKQFGTKTGRTSSTEPNFQSMPRSGLIDNAGSVRKSFEAAEGRVMVVCDFSQLEMRILAHFSQCPDMAEIFANNIDMHSYIAAKIEKSFYKKDIDYEEFVSEMKKEKSLIQAGKLTEKDSYFVAHRNKAKTVGFGLNYGKGVDLSMGITQEFIENYYGAIRGVYPYKEAHRIYVESTGYTTKLLGQRTYNPKVLSNISWIREEGHRESFAAHIQGSAADLMKLSMVGVHNYIMTNNLDCLMVAQVHDELILDCEESISDDVMINMQNIMENCYTLRVPLEAIPEKGKTWAEAK